MYLHYIYITFVSYIYIYITFTFIYFRVFFTKRNLAQYPHRSALQAPYFACAEIWWIAMFLPYQRASRPYKRLVFDEFTFSFFIYVWYFFCLGSFAGVISLSGVFCLSYVNHARHYAIRSSRCPLWSLSRERSAQRSLRKPWAERWPPRRPRASWQWVEAAVRTRIKTARS